MRENMELFSSVEHDISRVSAASEHFSSEISCSTQEINFHIFKRPCIKSVYYINTIYSVTIQTNKRNDFQNSILRIQRKDARH